LAFIAYNPDRYFTKRGKMSEIKQKKRIFISACEPSADIHCANLIKAFNEKGYEDNLVEWVGIGGGNMADAGCELLENTTQKAAMIYNVFGQLGYYYKLIKRITSYLQSNKVDLLIVCDSPAFNFHLAKAAKKAGTKVLFYVAPQLWAWASWRIGKLRRNCDKLACILPFEKQWFNGRGLDCEFVTNPLFDDLSFDIADSYKNYADFDPRKAKIAIFPGSRKAEIKHLWQPMQKIAIKLKKRRPEAEFVVSAVNEEVLQTLKEKQLSSMQCEYCVSDVAGTAKGSDLALVASGSATLQVAAGGCPMVIMYQSNRIMWHLVGRWLIKTRFLSLINILAGREQVSEFMPYFTSITPIFQKCNTLLSSKSRLIKISRELVDLVKPMASGQASENVAKIAAEMIK